MDWKFAKKHFDEVKQQYDDLVGVQGVNVTFALTMTFYPLLKRYNEGERTEELYKEMLAVK